MNYTNNKKRVTFVSEFFYPDEVSTGYIMTEIAKGLKDNYTINVICGGYNREDSQRQKYEVYDGVTIHRVWNIPSGKNNNLVRVAKQLVFSISICFSILIKTSKDDIVVAVTNPKFLVILLAFVSKVKKFKYIVLIHDLFPEQLLAPKLVSEKSIVYKILLKIFNHAYKKANGYIVLGEDMKQVLSKKINTTDNINIIQNWSQLELINPSKKENNKLISDLNLKNKLVIQFAGNIGLLQGFDFIISCAQQFKTKYPDVHFLFLGHGAYVKTLINEIKKNQLDNVTFLGKYKREEQFDILNACDVGLICLYKNMYGNGVPSKSYNIMAAGKPLLFVGHLESEISLMIKKYNIGWAVEYGDYDTFTKVIEEIKNNPNLIEEKGLKSREIAEMHFSYEKIIEEYSELLKKY